MSSKRTPAISTTSTGMTFGVDDPGMGEYERAGLAGLYMSLTAARAWERAQSAWPLPKPVSERLEALRKNVTNHQAPAFPLADGGYGVRVEWHAGSELAALKAIVNWAWQVHDGVFFLPGVHRKRHHLDCYYLRVHVHSGLLGTYFQFPTTIKKTTNTERKVERFDEERTFTVPYRPIAPDAVLPQLKAVPPKGVCDEYLIKPIPNWVRPGSEPRFKTAGIAKETGWRGPARLAYLMLFAPIACHFIKLPRSTVGRRSTDNWAYIVPHVRDLQSFQHEFLRRNMTNLNNWPFYGEAAGLEDASLRYVVCHGGSEPCLTVVMGHAAYYHDQQKTRKNLWRDLAVTEHMPTARLRYDVFNRAFPVSRTVRPAKTPVPEDSSRKGSHFVSLPSSRERIMANLLGGGSWYADLAYVPFWQHDHVADERKQKSKQSGASISAERLWFRKLQYERKQLMSITDEERMWDDPREKDVFDAFTQALRRLLNREQAAIGRGGDRDLSKRWDNTMDKWHRRLLNAKTGVLLSAAVHEFLALASRSPGYRNGRIVNPGGPTFLLPKQKGEEGMDWRPRNDAFRAEFRRMLNHASEWKKIRDLALLALTTFTDRRLVPGMSDKSDDHQAETDE